MSVRNAGKAIQEARLKAGLTQEKLSDGICSTLSLSRIENCSAGVSPSTFRALMSRAGADCEAFPTFANRTDFDCFYTLKRARFFLEAWQLKDAYNQLLLVQDMNWADNRFYYQEWLLLQYKIQFYNNNQNHRQLHDLLTEAIHISCPTFSIEDISSLLLSTVELELIISISGECLYLAQIDNCGYLCAQIESYLTNCQLTDFERERLLAQRAIVYTKYLIATKDYTKALEIADKNRHQMVLNSENSLLYELTFLTALGYYYTNDMDKFLSLFQTAFYCSHAIGSCYATTCLHYIQNTLSITPDSHIQMLEEIPYTDFPIKKIEDASLLHDGIFDAASNTIMYFGDLVRELRTEQKLSQQIVCQGLCSKSKLSKIENNYLQPDISLAEALLQRLGLSERVFTFWGTTQEQEINKYKFRIRTKVYCSSKTNLEYLKKLEQLISPQNKLNWQYLLLQKIYFLTNPKEKLSLAFEALHITLPNFDFTHINAYRLSWVELTLLNNICLIMDDLHASYYSLININYVLEYIKQNNLDVIYKCSVFPVTITYFTRALYIQKHYQEIISLKTCFKDNALYHSIPFLGNILGFYCQVLGEYAQLQSAELYGHYACSILNLTELYKNSDALKQFLLKDFHIDLTN